MCSVCPVWPPAAAGERADDVPKAFALDDEKRDMEGNRMITCRLSILFGERQLKISKVSRETGISRTTLTALYYDNGKSVSFHTLDTLCKYLGCGVGELLVEREDET